MDENKINNDENRDENRDENINANVNENVNVNMNENMTENANEGMNESMGNGEMAIPAENSTIFIVLGWISAIISLLAYPFIFGVVGVIMGILATKNNSRAGLPLIIASIILMSIGLIYSGVIMNYVRHYLGL